MTPSVNTSPLAALSSASAEDPSASSSPLASAKSSGAEGGSNDNESKFFNILQSVRINTSTEKSLVTYEAPSGRTQDSLFALTPHGIGATAMSQTMISGYGPARETGFGSGAEAGLGQAGLGQAQQAGLGGQPGVGPGVGQAQGSLELDYNALDLLSGPALTLQSGAAENGAIKLGSSLRSGSKSDLEQELIGDSLMVLLPNNSPAVSVGSGGNLLPVSGNNLPGPVSSGAATQQTMFGKGGQPAGAGPIIATQDSPALPIQKPETPAAILTPAQFERMPVPEFATSVAKSTGVRVGSTNPSISAAAHLDLSAHSADGETIQADLARTPLTVAASDRPSAALQAVTTLTLPRPAGSPGWDLGLGQRILWMVDSGLNQAELRLDPPNLGSVSVRISMLEDQAQLHFQATNQAAREALESALPKLREMFNQQGLELGDADVSDQNPKSDGEASDADREDVQAQRDPGSESELSASGWNSTGPDAASGAARNNRLVDEFV